MMRGIVPRSGGVLRVVVVIVAVVIALRVVGAVLGLLGSLPMLLLIGGLVLWLSDGTRARLHAWARRHRTRHGLVRGDGLPFFGRIQLAFWQGVAVVLKAFDRRERN